MKVYAVIGGINCEGENFNSLRLFDCKSSADAYYEHLIVNEGYCYAVLGECEVNMGSAIKV